MRFGRTITTVLAVSLLAGALLSAGAGSAGAAGGCVTVDVASSPEKLELLTDLAKRFERSSESTVNGTCINVDIHRQSSGAAATLLAADWPKPAKNGARPVIWSPAASTWGAVLDQRRADAGKAPYVTTPGTSFMLTPLVIAMPKPMADALGYPATPIGFSDILALAQDPSGWAGKGHPEWGPFLLGKTNPNFSTSGLAQTVAQYYAATGKTSDLTLEDLARPEVEAFARGVESAVVHYGDTTLTFLNNLYRADRRGNPFGYASAVAVEEKSLLDYNRGNPDGILDPGERPRKPRVPLVAIYPKEGTLFSDNPLITLDAPWVSKDEAAAARKFTKFVTEPTAQRRVLEYGFRPGNAAVAIGKPIVATNGVDPQEPQTTLEVPKPSVLAGVIDEWNQVRKKARALLVIDVSGSMGDEADARSGATKLDLAKKAAIAALGQFQPEDEVGLRIFSTEIGTSEPTDYRDVVPIGPMSGEPRRPRESDRAPRAHAGNAAVHRRGGLLHEAGGRVRPDPDQRRGAPHRRPQRGPPQREPRGPARLPPWSERGRVDEGRAHLHDRVRQRRRPGHAQAHRRGHQRCGVQRGRPVHDRQRLQRRHQQLLSRRGRMT